MLSVLVSSFVCAELKLNRLVSVSEDARCVWMEDFQPTREPSSTHSARSTLPAATAVIVNESAADSTMLPTGSSGQWVVELEVSCQFVYSSVSP